VTARTWRLAITAPARWVNANARMHYHAKARLTRAWRKAGRDAAAEHNLPRGLVRVHILVVMRFGDRRGRDAGNYQPTLKAVVDGLVADYGLTADDSTAHVIGPDARIGDPIQKRHRLAPPGVAELTITEVAE
jgi:hypothetical protein